MAKKLCRMEMERAITTKHWTEDEEKEEEEAAMSSTEASTTTAPAVVGRKRQRVGEEADEVVDITARTQLSAIERMLADAIRCVKSNSESVGRQSEDLKAVTTAISNLNSEQQDQRKALAKVIVDQQVV